MSLFELIILKMNDNLFYHTFLILKQNMSIYVKIYTESMGILNMKTVFLKIFYG